MTIDKLEDYYAIASTIEAIERELKTTYSNVRSPNGHEGGGSTTPGNPTEAAAMRAIALKEKVIQERERLYDLAEEIEDWLPTVEDLEVVSIIRWHYLLRLNWKQTNMKVYGYPDYSYSRKKIARYFEKLGKLS